MPVVEWPVSQNGFARLAGQWRAARVCLSLWSKEGRLVDFDRQAGNFWTTLLASGDRFTRALGDFARSVVEADAPGRANDAGKGADFGPWQPDVGLIGVPIRWRHRTVGAIVGAAVFAEQPGEAFSRLCSQCSVDQATMMRLAAESGRADPGSREEIARLLRWSVEMVHELEVGQEEASILTGNLENTYEELNLIYQISGQMRLPRKSSEVLENIGREVLEVSRAAAVAFVLSEEIPQEEPPHLIVGGTVSRPADRIIHVGESGAPGLHDIDSLAENLGLDDNTPPSYLLFNDACKRPEFRWAAGWLKHLVALPLWHERKLLGVFLAINCRDEGDYTSVDVQLLRAVADRIAAFLENQRLYNDLSDLLMGLLHALVNSIDAKDPYTCGHSERVAFYSRALARATGQATEICERVYLAGLLHDVGKIGVPDAVLCKPGRLTTEEFDAMSKHPEIGARILSRTRQITDLIPAVMGHHERLDGRGYPQRLSGGSVPLYGRIICLADCFDAMTTSRTYRTALPLPVAITELRRCSGTQFDPALAEVFLRLDLPRLAREARGAEGLVPTSAHAASSIAALRSRTGAFDVGPCGTSRRGEALSLTERAS